jgi:hypothetical protein
MTVHNQRHTQTANGKSVGSASSDKEVDLIEFSLPLNFKFDAAHTKVPEDRQMLIDRFTRGFVQAISKKMDVLWMGQ